MKRPTARDVETVSLSDWKGLAVNGSLATKRPKIAI